ncbi:hypothetical protein ACYSNQ_16650 [Enterococcus sp. LJL51]
MIDKDLAFSLSSRYRGKIKQIKTGAERDMIEEVFIQFIDETE